MENKRKSGMAYLFQLAGKYKLHLALSAIFGILSALCTFIPYIMVYQTLLLLFSGNIDLAQTLQYGATATLAIVGKFGFSIVSGTFSHLGLLTLCIRQEQKSAAI